MEAPTSEAQEAAERTRPLLEVRDLVLSKRSGDGIILRGIDLDVLPGQILGIVGETGAGKSLLGWTLLQLHPRAMECSGSITLHGLQLVNASERTLRGVRGSKIAVIPQEAMGALDPVRNVMTQMRGRGRMFSDTGRASVETVHSLLREVGFDDPASVGRKYPHELSGGMQQRVLIAMALVGEPELLIADEPTTALDSSLRAGIMRLLQQIGRDRGVAIILVSHDLDVVGAICDRLVVMYRGEIVETGQGETTLANPLHPYTRALLGCVPSMEDTRATVRLTSIVGEPERVTTQENWCSFAARCAHATDDCTAAHPLLRPLDDRLVRCIRAEDLNLLEVPES